MSNRQPDALADLEDSLAAIRALREKYLVSRLSVDRGGSKKVTYSTIEKETSIPVSVLCRLVKGKQAHMNRRYRGLLLAWWRKQGKVGKP